MNGESSFFNPNQQAFSMRIRRAGSVHMGRAISVSSALRRQLTGIIGFCSPVHVVKWWSRFGFSYISESSVLVSRNLIERWFANAILGNVSDLTRVIGFPVLVDLVKSWSSSEVTGIIGDAILAVVPTAEPVT
jgi:hypothetical protein